MDENQTTEQQPQVSGNPQVSTPPQPMAKRPAPKSRKRGALILVLLGLIGLGIFLVARGSRDGATPTPTPNSNLSGPVAPEPTETPEPVDKEDVSIEVLNGTGIAGEAGALRDKLATLGYSDIETGNADETDHEVTSVTFSSTLDEAIVDEITELLEETYEEVDVNTSSSSSVDVQIIIGLKKGQTPQPEATEEPEETATPTPNPSPSGNE